MRTYTCTSIYITQITPKYTALGLLDTALVLNSLWDDDPNSDDARCHYTEIDGELCLMNILQFDAKTKRQRFMDDLHSCPICCEDLPGTLYHRILGLS